MNKLGFILRVHYNRTVYRTKSVQIYGYNNTHLIIYIMQTNKKNPHQIVYKIYEFINRVSHYTY